MDKELDYIHILTTWCYTNPNASYDDFINKYTKSKDYITAKLYYYMMRRISENIKIKIKNIQNYSADLILSGH
jgi:hypothetical protein